jgi:diguanylate cyclase (GGDEF)-like protein/PAS domain S-box-containing protein
MLGGIRTRLLGLVVATVVPFTALIGAGLWTQWQIDQTRAFKNALDEARSVASRVDDEIGNFENLLAGLSQAVSTDPADKIKNDAMLRKTRSELPSYVSNILLTALDGSNIGTSAEYAPQGRTYLGDRDFFQEIVGGKRFAIGMPVRGRSSGQWVSTVSRAVEDSSGKLSALITVGIQLERFQDGLRVNELPPGSVVQIVGDDGTVIARSVDGSDWVGRNVSGDHVIARHMAMAEASEEVRWPDGIERITGSTMSRRLPWLISVGLPSDVALANVQSRLIWGVGVSLAALLVVLGLAWMLSSRIIRPLRELSEDASALALGDLSHRSSIRSRDEVGALAGTFNTMASSLEGRHRELDEAREAAAAEAGKRARSEDMERQAKETLAAVIDASPVAIVCSNTERRIVVWSRAAERIFGYGAEEMLGKRTKIIPPGDLDFALTLFARVLNGETIRDLEVTRLRKNGTRVDIRLAATPMYNPDGTVWGVAWAYDDITDRKKAERQLSHLAHYDQLTGLANRLALQAELAGLVDAHAADRPTAVALFDLDGFKDVNDTVGHSTGDQLLVQVAQRLSRIAEGRGKGFRLGGDEFVVLILDCGDPRVVADIVNAMLRQLAEPFHINDHVLHIGGSAGVAIAPNDGSTAEELIANADLALYKAKSEGGRTCRFFVPTLRAQAQMRQGLQSELRRAFADQEFELHFQPQIRLTDNAVVGAEALLRWRHPTQGLIGPGAFIEALSVSSIAAEVGRWIVQDACERAAAWRASGLPLGRLSVNLFPCQCAPALPKEVEAILQQTGLPADVLELEITETVALNHDDAIVPLRELHEKGIKLAFDDFGTGFASLSYLTRYPVSRIKIDRSFVAKISEDAQDAAIVRSLIAMAHNLGLSIIAEGVETAAQAAFLLHEGCEEAQGFLYAKPLSAADFEAYLQTRQIGAQDLTDARFYRAGSYSDPPKPSRRRLPRA